MYKKMLVASVLLIINMQSYSFAQSDISSLQLYAFNRINKLADGEKSNKLMGSSLFGLIGIGLIGGSLAPPVENKVVQVTAGAILLTGSVSNLLFKGQYETIIDDINSLNLSSLAEKEKCSAVYLRNLSEESEKYRVSQSLMGIILSGYSIVLSGKYSGQDQSSLVTVGLTFLLGAGYNYFFYRTPYENEYAEYMNEISKDASYQSIINWKGGK